LRPGGKTEPVSVFLAKNYYAVPEDSNVLLYPTSKYTVWWDIEQSKELARRPVNLKYSGIIAVSPTEPLLASSGKGDFIYLWNWQTRRPVDRLRGTRPFYGVAFSPDGRRLVAGSSGEGTLMLWDVSTRQEIAQLGIGSRAIGSVQFSPDGNIICAVENWGTAYFLRAPSMEKINAVEATLRQIERR
jgi:WD40 repeat protein